MVTIVRHDVTIVMRDREQTRLLSTVKPNRALLVEDLSRLWCMISRSWGSIPLFFTWKRICKKNHSNLNLQNLLGKYINSNFKLQFQTLQNQLKSINYFQTYSHKYKLISLHIPLINQTYTTHLQYIIRQSNCHILKLQNAIGCLCFIGPNLKTSTAMHVDLPYFKMLKTWVKNAKGWAGDSVNK